MRLVPFPKPPLTFSAFRAVVFKKIVPQVGVHGTRQPHESLSDLLIVLKSLKKLYPIRPKEDLSMNETIQGLLAKKWKDADLDLPVGETSIFQEFVVRISGTVEKSEDSWVTPTVSIPLISTLGFVFEKLGVDRDSVCSILKDAITSAMIAEENEDFAIKSRMRHVAEGIDFVKKQILQDLPKMRRSGRIDTKTLTVSVEALDATLAAA